MNYVDLATESDYVSELFNTAQATAWMALEEATRQLFYTKAAVKIDFLPYKYKGSGTTLVFPLEGQTSVPSNVVRANILWAYDLYYEVHDTDKEFELLRVGSQKVDFATTAFNGEQLLHVIYGIPMVAIWRYLSQYLATPRGD